MPAETIDHAAPAQTAAVQARWRRHQGLVNVRGDAGDPAFVQAVSAACGLGWPAAPGAMAANERARVLWAGPDDWFVLGGAGTQEATAAALRAALAGQHAAVTDVSSGYAVLELRGPGAVDLLAQGCPLDLHPRAFAAGRCAGTHFFKASVWLWRLADDRFEVLVRSSFTGYVEALVARCSLDGGVAWA